MRRITNEVAEKAEKAIYFFSVKNRGPFQRKTEGPNPTAEARERATKPQGKNEFPLEKTFPQAPWYP